MKKRWFETFAWILLLSAIFFGAWRLISNFYQQQVLSQQEQYLEKKADLLIRLSKNGADQTELMRLAENYVENSDERVTLLNSDGEIIFDTFDSDLSGTRSDRPEVQAVLSGSKLGFSVRYSRTLDQELLYVALPLTVKNQRTGILRIAEATAGFLAHAEAVKRSILFVYLLLCLLIILLLMYFLRQKNRPIETVLPVLKKVVANPKQSEMILQTSPQWEELYQTVNQLSEQMSQTYRAYTATEEQLYTLLNELMIGVFIIDEQHRLVMMNHAMQEQLGIFQEPELNRNFAEQIKDTQLIQLIYHVNEQTPFIHEEVTIREPIERVLDINLRIFNEQRQILGISYDLTRIRQLEKVQQDFVGNVSHELKTPVTSLIGFTETLLEGAKDDPETLTEFLTIMQKEAKRLERLIQEIIQLSRGEQDTHYAIETIQLYPLIKQLIAAYQTYIDDKNLTIVIEGNPQAEWPTKLELFYPIIKNLVENAIQYSPAESSITIRYQTTNTLTITVSDQGIGIDPDDQQRIFERFYRVDKARSRHSGGTGLGLAIVKDYTQRLQGTVTVESHLGVGSTFQVSLPKLIK
ncbi:sensor histidine kinase [Enterococcus mediterraneensis]|uniref:sensor histidine kinase n=1 Tax=Enterococcus mediterraneensis TaxID=2364791 RepID=UPI000F064EA5|nr:ATP-binding protein [Enterococcus mediterraneensis]